MVSRVLAVNGSVFIRNLLKQLLEGGYGVVGEAENGAEAVELHHELELDVVTMDVVMPIRNGIETTSEVKSLDADASVVMCTPVGQEKKMHGVVEAGTSGYIMKPFQRPSVPRIITGVTQVEV